MSAPQKIDFLLLPQFSMMAFTASVEPLRAANRMSGRTLYAWRTASVDGGRVAASNAVAVVPDRPLSDDIDSDLLIVCAGLEAEKSIDRQLCGRLREYARAGVGVGAVCTGSLALAAAGLLDGYRCTIHWENIEGFVEAYPKLDVTATLFEIDRNRYTCSGGTAPLDMMIYFIARDHGSALAISVAEQMLHTYVREPHERQRMSTQHRTGISNPKLLAAIAHMEAYLESPLPVAEIAEAVNISPRQLERLFQDFMKITPARYYLDLRLQRAKLLLEQTAMPVLQIAVATGFTSAAHFAKSYKSAFGRTPREARRTKTSGGMTAQGK